MFIYKAEEVARSTALATLLRIGGGIIELITS